VQHVDGKIHEEVVVLTEAVTEARIRTKGPVRSVELNQDHGALGHFARARSGAGAY
jgi:hypothetical protein